MIPAASAGETFEKEFDRSGGLDTLKLLEEVTLDVGGREELVELTTDGGYHESVEISCGCG